MRAYQLKIAIKNSTPPIWRRCIVPAGLTFSQLSMILNKIMGWSGYHLFQYEFYHLDLHISEDDGDIADFGYGDYDFLEASTTFINEYMEEQDWFTYIYDFGDYWAHRVTIEKVISDYEYNYPKVLKYKGVCPMEDCGGIEGYYDYLEILEDDSHTEHDDIVQWVEFIGYEDDYDIDFINEDLKEAYFVTYGKGEDRPQGVLYEARINGEMGLLASKTAQNVNEPIQSGDHIFDDSFQEIEDLLNALNFEDDLASSLPWNRQDETLEDIFVWYNKEDIVDLAKIHGMKGYSKYKKDELAAKTAEFMLQPHVMEAYFSCFRDDEIAEFKKASKTGKPYSSDNMILLDKVLSAGYGGFREDGLIEIPTDVAAAFKKINRKQFNTTRKARSFLLECFETAGILYGIVPSSVIVKIYNQNVSYFGGETLPDETALLQEYLRIPDHLIHFALVDDRFIEKSLLEDNYYKILERGQGKKDFYIPTYEEIESLVVGGFFPIEESLRALIQFLVRELGIDTELAEYAGREVQRLICSGYAMEDIIDYLDQSDIYFRNGADLKEFTPLINTLWNDTRMIINRGFKPNELSMTKRSRLQGTKVINFEQAKRDKIYPNDPCPCGSGKKYKHCCGKGK